MIALQFVFSGDSIFTGVKEETSYVAERARTDSGEELYESIVFDEEYRELFYTYFNTAKAELRVLCSAYIRDYEQQLIFQNDVTDYQNDCTIDLFMPDTYKKSSAQNTNVFMRNYLVFYVCMEWYKDKMPNLFELMRLRIEEYETKIKKSLSSSNEKYRIKSHTF